MKPVQLPLIRSIIEQFATVYRNNLHRTTADPVPVVMRVSSGTGTTRCIQLITTVGFITILDDGKLTEPDYPIVDIGTPDNWSKVSKGLIVSKSAFDLPLSKSTSVVAFADPEIDVAVSLLTSKSALPPVSTLFTPGSGIVFSESAGRSLTWTYDATGSTQSGKDKYSRLKSAVTLNPLECDPGLYGVTMPWHRAVAYMFPKDAETGQPTKIDGVAFARIGGRHPGIRLVSRELGIVVTLVCADLPSDFKTVTYYDINNKLVTVKCGDNYTAHKEEREESMEVKLIDMGQVRRPTAQPKVSEDVTKPAVVPVTGVEDSSPAEDITTPAEVSDTPIVTDTVHPETTTVQEVKGSEDLIQEALMACAEQLTALRSIQTTLKAALKQHKAEVKELKSNVKESEELVKLRASHKRLKALLLDADV